MRSADAVRVGDSLIAVMIRHYIGGIVVADAALGHSDEDVRWHRAINADSDEQNTYERLSLTLERRDAARTHTDPGTAGDEELSLDPPMVLGWHVMVAN